MMSIHRKYLSGSQREIESSVWFITSFGNHAGQSFTNLQSKVDNENNHNTILILSQNIDKNSYKSLLGPQ